MIGGGQQGEHGIRPLRHHDRGRLNRERERDQAGVPDRGRLTTEGEEERS